MKLTPEESREIRKGTMNIGAIVSFLVFSAAALIGGGKVLQKVDSNQMTIKEKNDERKQEIDELEAKFERFAEDSRFLQTQVQSINHKLQMKQDKQ